MTPLSGQAVQEDDSIAKMASALLDDTTDQERHSSQHSLEHLPQVRHSKIEPDLKGDFSSQVFESANGSYKYQSIFEARKATNRGTNRSLFRESYESTKQLGRKGKGAFTKMKNSVIDVLRSPMGKKKGNYLQKLPNYKGPEPLWNPLRMHPPGTNMQPPIVRNQLGVRVGVDESAGSGVEATHRKYATKSDFSRIPSKEYYPSEFDAVLSSSPDGHSTPRVRAEPSFKDSSRFRQKVHGAHSLPGLRASITYDPEIDIDEKQFGAEVSMEDGLKRKRIPEGLCSPKRTRKHSSADAEDLKVWKNTMDKLKKTDFVNYEDTSLPSSVAGCPTVKKDPIEISKRAQGPTYPNNPSAKNELHKGASLPDLRTESLSSTMRRQATNERGHRQRVANRNRNIAVMDVDEEEDELNWDNPNYILIYPRKP